MWGRRPGFATLVRIILEQQVSLVSAKAMFNRLNTAIQPFTPETFMLMDDTRLRALGLTRQKSGYLLSLAESAVAGELSRLARVDEAEARAALMKIKGIGPWTADIYLLMVLKRPDVWPSGDIALATAVMKVKSLPARPGYRELEEIAEQWRPYRSVAARMLWQYYLARDKNPFSLPA